MSNLFFNHKTFYNEIFHHASRKTIKKDRFEKGWMNVKLDLTNMPNGIYLCKIQNSNQNEIIKLIKNQ
jgi:hypothetical protein